MDVIRISNSVAHKTSLRVRQLRIFGSVAHKTSLRVRQLKIFNSGARKNNQDSPDDSPRPTYPSRRQNDRYPASLLTVGNAVQSLARGRLL